MRFGLLVFGLAGMLAASVATAQDAPPPQGPPSAGDGMGQRGWDGFMGGRGVVGTVTEVAPDHYTVKNQSGEIYIVHYSANTHIVKQPAHRPAPGGMRTPPEEIKPTDIKVGDAIMAQGEVDPAAKSVGALVVVKIDPERAREMREMRANFGKTWLMGRVTAIQDTKITLQSPVDNAQHTFAVDENTSFRKRREPVTLADVEVGSNVRVQGAVKEGEFVASTVNVMAMPPARGGPIKPQGPPPR
jgi:hypothetical protein